MHTIYMSTTNTEVTPDEDESKSPTEDNNVTPPPQLNLLNIPIVTEHDALNVIVGFLGVAQRRGVFAINESAKIFECVKMFKPTE